MPTQQYRTRKAPADNLVRTSNKSAIALKEDELNRVIGGKAGENPVEYLKIKMTDILISGVSEAAVKN